MLQHVLALTVGHLQEVSKFLVRPADASTYVAGSPQKIKINIMKIKYYVS